MANLPVTVRLLDPPLHELYLMREQNQREWQMKWVFLLPLLNKKWKI
jgi:phosphoenolpyruvate synthase/pyruvate phosphate dikinase